MSTKRIFVATAIVSSSSVAAMAAGLLSVKALAFFLGVAGMGNYSIVNNFYQVVATLAALGTSNGLIKYISEFDSQADYDRLQRLLFTTFFILLAASVVFSLATALLTRPISMYLFRSTAYAKLMFIIAAAIPFCVGAGFFTNALNGFRQIKSLALSNILPSLVAMLTIVPMVYLFGLKGAMLNILIVAIANLIITLHLYLRTGKGGSFRQTFLAWNFDRSQLRTLLKFGVATLVVGFVGTQVNLLVRLAILHNLGAIQNGIYAAISGLSLQALNVVIVAMSSYSLANFSSIKDEEEIRQELNRSLRVFLFISVTTLFFLSLLRKYVVLILFTSKFMLATSFIPLLVVGDFFRVVMWTLGLPQLPMARLKVWAAYALSWSAGYLGLSLALLPSYGLMGVVYAHIISHAVFAVVLYFDQRKAINFRFTTPNTKLVMTSLALLVAATIAKVDFGITTLLLLVGYVFWLWLNPTREEKKAMVTLFRNRLAGSK